MQGKRLRPALLLDDSEQGKTLVFDMARSDGARKPLANMKETVGKQKYNPDYNKHYDTFLDPLVMCVERTHGGSLAMLARRRHLQRARAAEQRATAALVKQTTGAYVRELEALELQKAVLRFRGNRMSLNRYLRDRKVRCMQSNAEAAARRAGRTRKWRSRLGSIDSVTFSGETFTEGFEMRPTIEHVCKR